ncbi:hypothetical protein MNEG_7810 [Monoraphidium neglectum]|jgi:hypothetical protein|uniref:Leucine-rich repeat-containing N-terminal plant-type domain-containing protein n=1 Tax=Monoraphidium neglectum TaxID=145388 RepID=A0A0D2MHN5_9CHLO|nr:hypothetical protein MNEG_7810 [Monoraphidium neglectum]KIZ00157.1 hypothetical protein MNEG_7810 [Monoraphidium neglectum]|eukprot:XP_013899176.1 hypothetical protein MNEG_7810 [Monoraphidium neglectum]
MARSRAAAAAALCCLLLCLVCAEAQTQGDALAKLQSALNPIGWSKIDPGTDACQNPGAVSPGVLCEGSTITEL